MFPNKYKYFKLKIFVEDRCLVGMNALRNWLDMRSFALICRHGVVDHVCFCGNGAKKGIVAINAAQSYQSKLSAILHECGHIIIFQRRRRNPRKRICGASYSDWYLGNGSLKRGTKRQKLNTLYEEVCAWELGEVLSRKLNIRINKKVFERSKTRALLTYTRGV